MARFRGFALVLALAVWMATPVAADEAPAYLGWQLREHKRTQLSRGLPTHVAMEATAQPRHYFVAADGDEVIRLSISHAGRLSRADDDWKRMASREIKALYPLGSGVVALSLVRQRNALIYQSASRAITEMASGVSGVSTNGRYMAYATAYPGIGRLETWAHDGKEARLVHRLNTDKFMVLKDLSSSWSVLGSEESFIGVRDSAQGSVSIAIDNKTGERTETYDNQDAVLPMLSAYDRDRTMIRYPSKDDPKAPARVMAVGFDRESRTIGVINLGIRDWDWKVKLSSRFTVVRDARVFDGGIVFRYRGGRMDDDALAIVKPEDAEAALRDGLTPRLIRLHVGEIIDFDANPNSSKIVTCGRDRFVQVWDVLPGTEPVESGEKVDPLPKDHRR